MEIVNNKICKAKPKDVKNGKVIIPYGVKAISSRKMNQGSRHF